MRIWEHKAPQLRAALVLVAALGAGAAQAETPAPVAAAVKAEAKLCRDLGGRPRPPLSGAITARDANGDGAADYLMDSANLPCAGATTSCGSGGCALVLWLSSPKGLVKAWEGLGSAPKLAPGVLSYKTRAGAQKLTIKGSSVR